MKKLCSTEGHFYVRTIETCAKRCSYCGRAKMPWSVESPASIRAYVKLLKMAESVKVDVNPIDGVSLVSNVIQFNRKERHA